MHELLDTLQKELAVAHDLERAAAVLEWDQETYMPEGGAEARAHQLATLRRLAHERFTADAVGHLLDQLAPQVEDLDPGASGSPDRSAVPTRRDPSGTGFEAALVRVTRRDYERARKLPADLVAALAEASSEAKQAWKKAREDDDFTTFAPALKRILCLVRKKADALGYDDTPYDALLDEYEPGTTTAEVEQLFRDLRAELVPIVEALTAHDPPVDQCLHQPLDEAEQWAFGEEVIRAFGYDFSRGRQDRSAHPFTTSVSTHDVRLTTRVDPDFFNPAFFATLHEAGHGLYEQGIDTALERTPLAEGASLGVHESQSRLWENLVGRSRPFWQHYYPKLQARFSGAFEEVPLDTFYCAINRVEPSLIRVEADEVTYNLHVMLRFELERALVEGHLAVDDLPEAWNARMEDYLGLTPPTDAEGVLQDVHWALGAIGYFPTYVLGSLLSVQFFEQARADLPNLDVQIADGHFEELLSWLREHIYRYGRTFNAQELTERVTGRPLEAAPWLAYVRRKFGSIYQTA